MRQFQHATCPQDEGAAGCVRSILQIEQIPRLRCRCRVFLEGSSVLSLSNTTGGTVVDDDAKADCCCCRLLSCSSSQRLMDDDIA